MAITGQSALLLDGSTLYGVFRQDVVSGEAVMPKFQQWTITDAAESSDPASATVSENVAESVEVEAAGLTRAMAFARAVKELPVDLGAPLALPPDLLVTRVLTLPATDAESLASMVRLKMEKFAPVTDDELEVDYEVIGATEAETRVIAVALPVSTLDKLATDLEKSGLAVTRIDSSMLCEWRSIAQLAKSPIGDIADGGESPVDGESGKVWLVALPSGRFDFFAADATGLVFARTLGTLTSPDDLLREVVLSLLDLAAERPDFSPNKFTLLASAELEKMWIDAYRRAVAADIALVAESDFSPYVMSALERDDLDGVIDIVPESWRADEQNAAHKRKFIQGAIAAVAVWVVAFTALTLIPKSITRQTAKIREEIAAVMPQYNEVAELRSRVRLIQSYEDRTLSALEMLRALCERMPDGMVLSSFSYENGEDVMRGRGPGGIKAVGDAIDAPSILRLKDQMDELGIFEPARLKGPQMDGNRSRYKFDLDWRFAAGGE